MKPTTHPLRARHRVHAPGNSVVGSVLKGVAAVTAAVVIAAGAAGGTFAYLNATAQVAGATSLTAGTANFTVSSVSALVGGNLTPLATSASYGTYTLTNTGDVRLTITPSVAATSANATTLANTKLDLAIVADGTTCSGVTYNQWSKTGTAAATGSLTILAARNRLIGSAATPAMRLCARATLLSTAPVAAAGGTVNWTIQLDGAQAW